MSRAVRIAFVLSSLALSACGGSDSMEGHTLQNLTATAQSGKSQGTTHVLWSCMTWEPAGKSSSTSHRATIGCGAVLPAPAK